MIDGVRESCSEIRTTDTRKDTALSQASIKEHYIFRRCTS